MSIATAQLQPADTIPVKLENGLCHVATGTTLAKLVADLGHEARSVSTALNGQFVPRAARDTLLQPHDEVLIFQAIVGG